LSNEEDNPKYRRILIKLSGEALAGEEKFGITGNVLEAISKQISDVMHADVQVGIVIGGGNFFRGMSAAASNMDRVTADYIGMLATVMNALALHQALEAQGTPARIQSALDIASIVESYVRARTFKHMDNRRAVIFAGGTGNPLFTTDTAASLRAIEINAQLMIKGTKVDGVFDDDPATNPAAKRYDVLTYEQVLRDNLRVMDATAITLCRDHGMPIRVVNINRPGSLLRAVQGLSEGTLVK
jgi:uridylate kinase